MLRDGPDPGDLRGEDPHLQRLRHTARGDRPAKVDRLRRLAAAWLRVHSARPDDIRLDLVAVIQPRDGEPEIDHVRGLT